jgi:hypothetical protein
VEHGGVDKVVIVLRQQVQGGASGCGWQAYVLAGGCSACNKGSVVVVLQEGVVVGGC